MAHEIESMFFTNETPWHRLGTRLEAPPTTGEAIVAAGLDWTIDTKPLFTADGEEAPARATYRVTDGKLFGVVGAGYTPLQNKEAFAFFDPFVEAGEATLETAGSLREGKRVWVLAKLARSASVIVPKADDVVEKFILLSNSHDGTLAVRVGFTPIRVVCANTLALAQRCRGSRLLRVRHQKNVVHTLTELRSTMNVANAAFEATAEQFRQLANTSLVEADLRRYVTEVFDLRAARAEKALRAGASDAAHVASMEPANDVDAAPKSRVYDAIVPLFEKGRGNDLPGVKGTWWAAYNAVTEYLGYERGRSDDTRVDSMWFGGGAMIGERALDTALRMAA